MKLHGVFVGIDEYLDTRISPLRFAERDAAEFYNLIVGHFHPRDVNLRLLLGQNASRASIMHTIGEEIAHSTKPNDIVLLFFACHGAPEVTHTVDIASRYLITSDTQFDSIFATGIDLERDLTQLMRRLKGNVVVAFLDSCFSGRAGGRTFEGPTYARLPRHRGLLKAKDIAFGKGRLMLSACDDNQVAAEDPSLRHGVFTYFLLKELTDVQLEADVAITTLYERVHRQVNAHTRGAQTPVLNGRDILSRLPRLK